MIHDRAQKWKEATSEAEWEGASGVLELQKGKKFWASNFFFLVALLAAVPTTVRLDAGRRCQDISRAHVTGIRYTFMLANGAATSCARWLSSSH